MDLHQEGKILEKVKKLFPHHDHAVVTGILDQYGLESYGARRVRVQLAILKVFQEGAPEDESVEKSLERLRWLVRAAKVDYRDFLAWAEYPAESREGVAGMKRLSSEDALALRERDREQYERWLNEP